VCGFAGIASSDPRETPDVALLAAMGATLAHRGPDDGTELARGGLGIAFRRLSIIDVEGGRQPILNEAGDVAVVCNGEIYNFLELRSGLEARGHRFRTGSDVETIVHLYEEEGERCVERLVGMFAIAILDWRDPARARLLLARDRIGIKPLYYATTSRGLVFGSETKALLASGCLPRRLRREALLEYLVAGYTSGPESAWEGIRRLPPATTMRWTAGGEPALRRYWGRPVGRAAGARERRGDPRSSRPRRPRPSRVRRPARDLPLERRRLERRPRQRGARATGRRRPDDALGARSPSRVHGRVPRGGLRRDGPARATAERLGAEHEVEILDADPRLAVDELPWFFDEPLADPSTVPTLLVSRMARARVTVALSGDGGDEVFAGYRRYVFDVAENRARAVLGKGGTKLLGEVGRRYPKLDWAPRVLRAKSTLENLGADPARAYWQSLCQLSRDEALSVLDPELARSLAGSDPFDRFEDHYRRPRIEDPLFRAQYADFHHFLPDRILVKSDRAAMAASLEVRPPLLDHRIVERFVPLPAKEKVRGGRGKFAFRRALRARLPASVLDARKRGFDIPLAAWTRGPLAPAIRESIDRLPPRWFDRRVLGARVEEHASGARDHSHLLWSVLVLERWRSRHGAGEDLA
jgi:asparagine synthase (glutamine-hydrolysing)